MCDFIVETERVPERVKTRKMDCSDVCVCLSFVQAKSLVFFPVQHLNCRHTFFRLRVNNPCEDCTGAVRYRLQTKRVVCVIPTHTRDIFISSAFV